ncbi:MAG TPA: hypothetical protein VFA55_07325 [Candidatus Kapabacteria bacterium]|nr:hypothetical protein [Candidatus Kapabacteria bacterium]
MKRYLLYIFLLLCTGIVSPLLAQDTLFDSSDPKLPCTFQYPISWTKTKSEGVKEQYSEYDLTGPVNAEKTYSAHISMTAMDPASAKGKTPNEYLDRFLDSVKALHDHYEVLSRTNTVFWGQSVPTIDVAYAIPLPYGSAKFTWTIIRERRAVTVNNGKLWTFVYAADKDDFDKYVSVYQHLMETFFFK